MDVDILFPFHRVNVYFEDALASINESKSISFKLIAIDDRPDQSQDITRFFANFDKYEIVRTAGGEGYGAALSAGTKVLEAPFTALFNSDDLVNPLRLKTQITQLDNHELSISSLSRIDSNGNVALSHAGSLTSEKYDPFFLLFGAYGANATWCMHTTWWEKNAFFDSDECLDWRIAMSSFRKTEIGYINHPLYIYRKHKSQLTSIKDQSVVNRMGPVFDKWNLFAQSYLLSDNTRDIFDTFATPWLRGQPLKFTNVNDWLLQVQFISANFDEQIQNDLKRIIKRRFIFALRNKKNSIPARLNCLIRGSREILPLIHELVT